MTPALVQAARPNLYSLRVRFLTVKVSRGLEYAPRVFPKSESSGLMCMLAPKR